MNHLPADLSPEAAAWLQTQMVIANAQTAAILREEIDKSDEWATGVFCVVRDLMGELLADDPRVGRALAKAWKPAALSYERGDEVGPGAEPMLRLEARRMLYRFFVSLGFMPGQ
ncbi:hypothetical protein CKO44_01155 [Rubrivivax gelatinosus]|uniref:hypothetical protein n=1 Tax=Rubrivivax gelatinosus TaxID=28068 RepID=UPI0019070A7D|nr:hypothetical protein [Rubrivivax gelatinosus]MBK1612079.1 hypothetical protein [Rubrivivax gelatinosus]MBZ8143254.1 hypothetical protein [Rubrivivax gelatinosus]